MLLTWAFRHLLRHWRLNLVVLAGMTLGTALLSGISMYATVIAGQSLSQSLADAYPSVRNLGVRGIQVSQVEGAEIGAALEAALGDLGRERVEIRDAIIDAKHVVYQADGEQRRIKETLWFRFWSLDPLDDAVEIAAGRWPEAPEAVDREAVLLLEAVVGAEAAAYMELGLGDELASTDGAFRLRIVGLVRPLDPRADIWWGDPNLVPLNVERQGGGDIDNLFLSLILPSEVMGDFVSSYEEYWRVLVDWDAITVDNALAVHDRLVQLEARLSAGGVKLDTGLVELIDAYRAQRAVARVSLLLLTAQSLLAVLYTLGTVGAFMLDRSQVELASLAGRGFGGWQIARVYALEAALLAFCFALPLGPTLARLVLWAWSRVTGNAIPRAIPAESWALSLIAVLFGWAALVVPIYVSARRNLVDWQRQRARPPRRSPWQRLSLDFFALALGGLAYWQLLQSRNLTGGGGASAVDPVLLLGPSLLLLAIGLILTRLFPPVLRLAAWAARSLRGMVLPWGLTRLARDPGGANRVVLLIGLAAGLVFFATTFEGSIVRRQEEVARYQTGADLRVALPLDPAVAGADAEQIARLPGVLAASPIYRARSRWSAFRNVSLNFEALNLLAVEPDSLMQVVYYAPDVDEQLMAALLADLKVTEDGVLPVLLSPDAPPRGVQVGDRVQYHLGPRAYDFEVRGIIDRFPTLDRPFAITNLPALGEQIDFGNVVMWDVGWRELWLEVDPARHRALVEDLEGQTLDASVRALFQAGRIAGDAQARLRSFQVDPVARATVAAFNLNAGVLVVLSSASFLLVQVLAVRRRASEIGVLRAIGLASRQLVTLLGVEGLSTLLLGLLVGTGVGYGLAYVMRPFLSLALAPSLGGDAIDRVLVAWPAIARLYAILAGFYVLALVLLLVGLLRSRVHRSLRIGDE